MGLLALARDVIADEVEVATVDHGLRAEAADECALVASHCDAIGIPCRILPVRVSEGNLQDRARAARYAALGRWAREQGLAAIATGHHADDQAETVIMRLNRGSGLAGLAGIRPSTLIEGCCVPVIRPLLGFGKAELLDFVNRRSIPFVEDPSNRDSAYDRVRIRRELAQVDWLDPLALARSAAHLAEVDSDLQALADREWDREAEVAATRITVPVGELNDTTARLIARAIATLGGSARHGEVIGFLKTDVSKGNIAGVLIERVGKTWICVPEPPRKSR
ncbi:hypothetical protein MTsN3n11_17580 [Qipengyuania sp. MTN3-11]